MLCSLVSQNVKCINIWSEAEIDMFLLTQMSVILRICLRRGSEICFFFQKKGLLAFDFGATVAPYPPYASKWVYLRPCVSHHHGETTPICRPISRPTPLFVSDPGLSTSCWGRFNCHKRPLQVINKGLQWRFSALLNWFLASEGNSTRAFNLDSHKRHFQLTCSLKVHST